MGPKKKKGGKPNSPEAKRKAEQLAKLQKEQEEEQKRLEEEEKKRALEAAKRLLSEQFRRNKLLKSSCRWFRELSNVVGNLDWEKRKRLEWISYLDCKNLPVACDIPMINTYLFMLRAKRVLWNVDDCFEMSPKLLTIIDTLDDYIDNPLGASYRRIDNWKDVRNGYRNAVREGIDMTCYGLLRDLDQNLTAVDLWTYEFRKSCEDFFLGLWAFGEYPKLTGYPDHNFDEIGISVTLPEDYVNKPGVLRVMKMKYNHLNDTCVTDLCPTLPEEYNTNFYTSVSEWFIGRVQLMGDFKFIMLSKLTIENWYDGMFFQEIISNGLSDLPAHCFEDKTSRRRHSDQTGINNILFAKDEDQFLLRYSLYLKGDETEATVPVPIGSVIDTIRKVDEAQFDIYCNEERTGNIATVEELIHKKLEKGYAKRTSPTNKIKSTLKATTDDPTQIDQILEEIDTRYTERVLWKRLETQVEKGEINLRRHNVIGHLFSVELFQLPEQEILINDNSRLRTIKGEAALELADFKIKYIPPTIVEEKQEDEEGKERKKDSDMINKLMKVTVGLEENCLWFEPPSLVQWNPDKRCWSDEFIVDSKYNEEKQNFTFRVGCSGIFGFLVNRYGNLPYQTWDLRPDSPDSVLFNLTASTVIVDFKIKRDKVCIVQIQNAPSSVLDHLVNVYLDPPILIKKMRRFGLDVFPDYDTFHYVEGSTYKDILLENHTYACMAFFSSSYNFTWSRWNSFSGRNKIVFQMREALEKNSTANYSMLMASTERALIVECTEVSPSFVEKGVAGMKYYPDLYSLVCFHCSEPTAQKIKATHPYLVQTVYTMLSSTRVFTFS